ncbi:thioredoxin domain-containing protein [Flavobacteriaceae bacterium 3-367]
MNDSVFHLVRAYLRKENIIINFEELKFQLLSHPSYPSLHSITGVLSHFNIDHGAFEVPKDQETLQHLPDNFITLTSDSGQFIWVTRDKRKNRFKINYSNNQSRVVTDQEFLDQWESVVLALDTEGTEQLLSKETTTRIFKLVSLISLILIVGSFFPTNAGLSKLVHFILSTIGILTSILILNHEFGFHSVLVEKFCTSTKFTNCQSILNSNGAMVTKFLKLSDLCLIYFVGLSILGLNTSLFIGTYSPLFLISFLALPAVVYSIYHQGFVTKKWCPLCLIVVSVLLAQSAVSIFNLDVILTDGIALKGLLAIFLVFICITSFWISAKPYLLEWFDLKKQKIEYHRFRRNFNLFRALLLKESPTNMALEKKVENEIVLGNRKAFLNIVVVTNPSCYYCGSAHREIEKILEKNAKEVSVTIRFCSLKKKDGSYLVAERLLEMYNTEFSPDLLKESLREAYHTHMEIGKWLLKWGKPSSKSYRSILLEQEKWCSTNGINFTPAILINGRLYPKEFKRTDLSYFMEEWAELVENKNKDQVDLQYTE